jgi:hypothetical protein
MSMMINAAAAQHGRRTWNGSMAPRRLIQRRLWAATTIVPFFIRHVCHSTDSTPTNWETRRWTKCVMDRLRLQPEAVNDEHRSDGARQARQTLDIDMIPFITQEWLA